MKIFTKPSAGVTAAVAVLLTLVAVYATQLHGRQPRLLLAPMIGLMEPCILARPGNHTAALTSTSAKTPSPNPGAADQPFREECTRANGSAAALLEGTLARLGPQFSPGGAYEVGYTLQFSLFSLLQRHGDDWVVNQDAVQRLVRTLRDTDRSAVLYLFSTHFGINAPIEKVLAQDAANLSVTPQGTMPQDKYYDIPIHAWTFATTHNDLTRRRVQVIDEIVDQICRLPPENIAKIKGITLLGELHHFFPDFETGMGFADPYVVSDYSAASVAGFNAFLTRQFGTIAALNTYLGADYARFSDVAPPSKNIRTQTLQRYTEHIDSYAHGSFPISGWAHVAGSSASHTPWVRIYRNGQMVARAQVHLGRQDVSAALPALGTADVGWRYDMDFKQLSVGVHRLDIFLEQAPGMPLLALGTRNISVMDKTRRVPQPLPVAALPASDAPGAGVKFYIDGPADASAYFYNPLVPLWHAFRSQQVADYVRFIDARVRRDCLKNAPTYTHQIMPFTNPSWDSNKFAVEASLQPVEPMQLGVSLYGETTYGSSFFDWLASSGKAHYGVTEFHPLRAMDAQEMALTLQRHHRHGARFVSFFMESLWIGTGYSADKNMFSFDPKNTQSGSDRLFDAVKAVVSQ